MRSKTIWQLLSFLMVAALILAACQPKVETPETVGNGLPRPGAVPGCQR